MWLKTTGRLPMPWRRFPADHYQENNNKEVYRFPFSSIDPHHPPRAPTRPRACSPLHRGCEQLRRKFSLPNVAAICVYPTFAAVVRTVLWK